MRVYAKLCEKLAGGNSKHFYKYVKATKMTDTLQLTAFHHIQVSQPMMLPR